MTHSSNAAFSWPLFQRGTGKLSPISVSQSDQLPTFMSCQWFLWTVRCPHFHISSKGSDQFAVLSHGLWFVFLKWLSGWCRGSGCLVLSISLQRAAFGLIANDCLQRGKYLLMECRALCHQRAWCVCVCVWEDEREQGRQCLCGRACLQQFATWEL